MGQWRRCSHALRLHPCLQLDCRQARSLHSQPVLPAPALLTSQKVVPLIKRFGSRLRPPPVLPEQLGATNPQLARPCGGGGRTEPVSSL